MKNKRKAFWKNIKFKYKLTIINENTLEEIVGIHVSKLNGFIRLAFCRDRHLSDSVTYHCVYALA